MMALDAQRPQQHPPTSLRDSRFESAQQADDIYALYGRDSWVATDDNGLRNPSVYSQSAAFHPSPLREGDQPQALQVHPEQLEELDDFDDSDLDSDGDETELENAYRPRLEAPLTFPAPPPRVVTPTAPTAPPSEDGSGRGLAYDNSDDSGSYLSHHTRSLSAASYEPSVSSVSASMPSTASPVPQLNHPASSVPVHVRDMALTPPPPVSPLGSSSNLASPVRHPSVTRLNGTGRGAHSPNGTSLRTGPTSIATSQASLVSSQYPGEEADAFHVRSTYARLDVEGVWGDGWDEGVERTRGGMSSSDSARLTVMFPTPGAMGPAELKFVTRLDRHGFIDAAGKKGEGGRVALVPSSPFRRVPKLKVRPPSSKPADPNAAALTMMGGGSGEGPAPKKPPPPEPRSAADQRIRRKEGRRVAKWMRMMSVRDRDKGGNVITWGWTEKNGQGQKYPTRVYKGIPDRWRMAAWWTLVEQRAAKASRPSPPHDALEADYQARRNLPSTSDVQIDLDVPRTISGHVLFRTRFGHGQRALFHVLHAFSQACGTCGYCQGMGSVAATLLCYFEPERAYTLLVRLHDLYDMHGIFAPGFPGLLETFYVQERMLESIMPDVYDAFQRNMISSSAWGAKIYITLFVNTVPFTTQLRIWDALFLDGYDVMVIGVIAILWAFRDLLASPKANFESILNILSSYFVPQDEDAMLLWMRKLLWAPGVRDKIAHWRREWRQLVAEGKSGTALL